MEYIAKFYHKMYADTPQLARVESGFLLKEILEHFTQKINSTLEPDRSLWFYSGHSITISFMLQSLGVFKVDSKSINWNYSTKWSRNVWNKSCFAATFATVCMQHTFWVVQKLLGPVLYSTILQEIERGTSNATEHTWVWTEMSIRNIQKPLPEDYSKRFRLWMFTITIENS